MKGVALKIRNHEKETAADIINHHFRKMKEKESVYYSTNVAISKDREIDQVLFYFVHRGDIRFVTADVVNIQLKETGFVPKDSEMYSPTQYKDVPKVSWLLLKNMKEVSLDYINGCEVLYTNGTVKGLMDVIVQPRINRVYYSTSEADNDDILIK